MKNGRENPVANVKKSSDNADIIRSSLFVSVQLGNLCAFVVAVKGTLLVLTAESFCQRINRVMQCKLTDNVAVIHCYALSVLLSSNFILPVEHKPCRFAHYREFKHLGVLCDIDNDEEFAVIGI